MIMWLCGWLVLLAAVCHSLHVPYHRRHHGRFFNPAHPHFNLKYTDAEARGRISLVPRAEIISPIHIDNPQNFIKRIRREIITIHGDVASFLDKSKQEIDVKGHIRVKRQTNDAENKLVEAKLRKIADKLIKILINLSEEEPRNDSLLQTRRSGASNDVNNSIQWQNFTHEIDVRSNVSQRILSNVNLVVSNNSGAIDNNVTSNNSLNVNQLSPRMGNDDEPDQSVQQVVFSKNDYSLEPNNSSVGSQQLQDNVVYSNNGNSLETNNSSIGNQQPQDIVVDSKNDNSLEPNNSSVGNQPPQDILVYRKNDYFLEPNTSSVGIQQPQDSVVDSKNDNSLEPNNSSVESQQPQNIVNQQSQNLVVQQPLNGSVVQSYETKEPVDVANNIGDSINFPVNNVAVGQQLPDPYPEPHAFIMKRSPNLGSHVKRRVKKAPKETKKHSVKFPSYVPMKRSFDTIHKNIEHHKGKKKRQISLLGELGNLQILPDIIKNVNGIFNANGTGIYARTNFVDDLVAPFRTNILGSIPKDGNFDSKRPPPYTVKDSSNNFQRLSDDGTELVAATQKTK